jgi:hypothetical protein
MTLTPAAGVELKALLASNGTSVTDLLERLATRPKPPTDEDRKPIPVVVPVSDEQKKILKAIIARAEKFAFPAEPRVLTDAEAREAISIYRDIKQASAALANFEAAFKATFHNSLDVALVAAGEDKGVPQNGDGHYVARGEIAPAGIEVMIRRETSGGAAAALTLADLADMEAKGDITHKEYLAMTREVPRVLVPDAIMAHVRKAPEFTKVLKRYARLTTPTASINIRPNKVKK